MYWNVVADLISTKKARRSGVFVVQRVEDKTAATHFECFRRLFAYMESGILVEAFVWDGALHSSCDRLHRQYMAAYHHSLEATREDCP